LGPGGYGDFFFEWDLFQAKRTMEIIIVIRAFMSKRTRR
jgi:hypothetical protein